jgi:hypothetical protein
MVKPDHNQPIYSFIKTKRMIVTYDKAEIVEDENGKMFLHLELQAFIPGTRIIIQNTFPASSNFDPLELLQSATDDEVAMVNENSNENSD